MKDLHIIPLGVILILSYALAYILGTDFPSSNDQQWTMQQIRSGVALCAQYDGVAFFEDGTLQCMTEDNVFDLPKIPRTENMPP